MESLIGGELSVCHRWRLIGCALFCAVGRLQRRAVTWLVDPQRVDRWTVGLRCPMRVGILELECGAGRARSGDWEELEERMEVVEA